MIEIDKLYNMDCLDGMKQIPDGTVDAIICDPPYGVLNKGSKGGSWDVVIPFEPMWEQYRRITKPTAAIVLFAQGMFTAQLMMSQPKIWRYNLVWDKKRTTGFLNARRMPLRCHEDICVFYKKLSTYNPQMEELNGREINHPQSGAYDKGSSCYGKYIRKVVVNDKKYPRSILSFSAVHCNEHQFHPTQKPLDLMRYLVRTYSDKGNVILDNCAGSGSTLVAALKEGRHFIGFELNKEYFDKATRRINEVERNLFDNV